MKRTSFATATSSTEPKAGRWYAAWGTNLSTAAFTNGTMRGARFPVGRSCTLTGLGVEVTTAGSAGALVRVAAFVMHPTTQDLTLLVDAGTVDGTVVAISTITVSAAVTAGQQLILAAVNQGAPTTTATLRSVAGHDIFLSGAAATDISGIQLSGISISGVTGAAPSNPGSGYGLVGSVPRVLATFS